MSKLRPELTYAPRVALPFVLSPYLRPLKVAGREGFILDDGVTGWIELDAPMQSVVRALWEGEEAGAAQRGLAAASARHGHEVVTGAIDRLKERRVVFDNMAACDEALDAVVDAASPARVPFVDQIELTNICPFRCQFCPRGVEDRAFNHWSPPSTPLWENGAGLCVAGLESGAR